MRRGLLFVALTVVAFVAALLLRRDRPVRPPATLGGRPARLETEQLGGRPELAALDAPEVEARTVPGSTPTSERGGAEPSRDPGTLSLRIGPRPRGVAVRIGRFPAPRLEGRRPTNDRGAERIDRPDWYVQEAGLAVSLSRRDGAPIAAPRPFEGSATDAGEPLELTWTGLEDGLHDLHVELRGDVGGAVERLLGIVVDRDAARDPRLERWDPMRAFASMELLLRLDAEDTAERFVIGVSRGDRGRAFGAPPRLARADDEAAIHGPYLVVEAIDRPAMIRAFDETGGEGATPFREGSASLALPDAVYVGIRSERVEGGVHLGDVDLYLRRLAPPGKWRPPIRPQSVAALHLPPGGAYSVVAAPAPGEYRWIAEDGNWSSEPFRVERSGTETLYTLRLAEDR
ncbi:MAG: hypothetical protein AAGB93_02230 [Planctomycetota bacterium]